MASANIAKSVSESKFAIFSFFLFTVSLIIYFVVSKIGKEYKISRLQKMKLAVKFLRICRSFYPSSFGLTQCLLLAQEIFHLPKSLKGDVVECGCWNGQSAIVLSLACALADRKLIICDSFEGLPRPREEEKCTRVGYTHDYRLWREGDLSSQGGLDGVKER